jgi:hypothetical protein
VHDHYSMHVTRVLMLLIQVSQWLGCSCQTELRILYPFFLHWVRDGSLAVSLAIIMTNQDLAQIGALEIMYLDSWIFLCMWHVLHAMQTHFNACEFLELWTKVRA